MKNDERKIKAHEKWVKTYVELGSITKAALRCGVSRPTLYRWVKRYEEKPQIKLMIINNASKKIPRNKIIINHPDNSSSISNVRVELSF